MPSSSKPISLNDDDLREIFSLFTSATKHEREQVYNSDSGHDFKSINLYEEYSLTEEKREYALDAWRAVIFFLYSKGFEFYRDGQMTDMSFSDSLFID